MSAGKCQSSSRWRSHTPSGTAPGETRDEPSVVGVRGRWARRGTGTALGGRVALSTGAAPQLSWPAGQVRQKGTCSWRQRPCCKCPTGKPAARGSFVPEVGGRWALRGPGHSACSVSSSTRGPTDSGGAVARRPVLLPSLPSVVERAGRAQVGSGRSLHRPLPWVGSGLVSEPPALSYALRLRLHSIWREEECSGRAWRSAELGTVPLGAGGSALSPGPPLGGWGTAELPTHAPPCPPCLACLPGRSHPALRLAGRWRGHSPGGADVRLCAAGAT